MRKLLFLLGLSALVSCGTLPQKYDYYVPVSYVELGFVGKKQKSVHQTEFKAFGIPKYENKVRLKVIQKDFSKSYFKKYTKAAKLSRVTTNVVYNDSIAPKPTFLNIDIEDRVSVVSNINAQKPVFNYLKRSPQATIVSGLQIVPSNSFMKSYKNADAVYLETDHHDKQWFLFYKKGKLIEKIDLNNSTIFGYKLSSFCWEATERRKIKIATIVDEGSVCTKMTKRNPEKLEQELTKSSFDF
ncbi:hypothetical protein [Tenacibaculum sp. M341]|uniref:hypothetical protein n=1 Tax=Tenacibaculum sp. M341 TaxID=2530339 RepID=UPI0010523D75|nr:hypothetical protein [Tenacibaculum sp. M341]TCI85589.1 hypothetical protein EYW44_16655 [Tenacibaculum sp. M341]